MLYSRLYLPDPEKGEKIEMILRRHSFTLVSSIILYGILLLVPLFMRWLVFTLYPGMWENSYLHPIFYMAGSIYVLFIILFFYSTFIDYWLDVWVITNERIVSTEQKSLFSRTLVEQKLYNLQDITSKVEGFFPTFFHYGDIIVQSSASVANIVLKQVSHPDVVARKIIELMEQSKQRHGLEKA